MNNPLISREVLNDAAAAVLQILKSIDAFQDAEIVVIGGLAQWEHLREAEGRATRVFSRVIDFGWSLLIKTFRRTSTS
jgi:hypothetical protein